MKKEIKLVSDNPNVRVLDAQSMSLAKDSLTNFVANMGTSKDKMMAAKFEHSRTRLDPVELEALYREDWIAGKITDIIPDEMTRAWRSFADSELDEDDVKLIEKAEKQFKVKKKVMEAESWARLYGGALIVMNIENTGEPWEPLDLERVKKGSLKAIAVYDSENAHYSRINNFDPFADNFNMPETYRLAHTSIEIHHTRVLRFDGQKLPWRELKRNRYWHDSILNRVHKALVNAETVMDSTAALTLESTTDVIKIKNLMTTLATKGGEKMLTDRFLLAKFLKANNNITLLDSDEEYVVHRQTFAGLPDLLDRFMTIVSATSDVPATRLFGKAPVGMNATGESDMRNFYDMINSKQINSLGPKMDYLDEVLSRHLGIDPDEMDYDWNALWQLSDTETSTIQKQNAERDAIYEELGVIKPSQIATQLMEEDVYIAIDSDHIKEVEKLEEEELEEPDVELDEEGNPIEKEDESEDAETSGDPDEKKEEDEDEETEDKDEDDKDEK